MKGLVYHQHGTDGNKKIAVNEEIQWFEKILQRTVRVLSAVF